VASELRGKDRSHAPVEEGTEPERFDFRRPNQFAREKVRGLEIAHEVFARRFSSGLGNALRAFVQLDPVSIDQVSYDDYIRSMPNPNVVTVMTLAPLPGAAVVELNVQLALLLVDRLLGGRGAHVSELRRPTDLETFLLRDVMQHAVEAVGETLEPFLDGPPELSGVEYNPQLVQIAAPSDMVLLLTYRLTVSQGPQAEGLLTLCYPMSTLAPLIDRLTSSPWDAASGESDPGDVAPLLEHLLDADVTLTVRIRPTTVPARDLARLQVGDVLSLDHQLSAAMPAHVAGVDLLEGHLGRRGRRLAFQVADWVDESARPLPVVADSGLR
jgi:flagellar motor switch protein FliM